jgi:hypothetical protein
MRRLAGPMAGVTARQNRAACCSEIFRSIMRPITWGRIRPRAVSSSLADAAIGSNTRAVWRWAIRVHPAVRRRAGATRRITN